MKHMRDTSIRRLPTNRILAVAGLGALLLAAASTYAAIVPQEFDRFVEARRHQLRGEYELAAKQFTGLESPLLQAAARCEIARGYMANRQYDKAVEQLTAVLNAPANLYQGEAHYLLARLNCWRAKTQEDFLAIDAQLQAAADFCRRDFSKLYEFGIDQSTIEKLRDLAGPARYDPALACAGTIANPVSTEWYLPQLQAEILRLRIYVASQFATSTSTPGGGVGSGGGDTRGGADAADAIQSLISQNRYVTADPAVLARLRSEGVSGSFVVAPDVWRGLSGDDAPMIRFALFLAVSGSESNVREALGVFQHLDTQIEAQGLGSQGGENWAVVHLGEGLCHAKLGQTQQAIDKLQRFKSLFRRSAVSSVGQLALANALVSEPKTHAEAVRLYHEIADRDPGSKFSAHTMLCLMIAGAEQKDFDQVMAAADFIGKHHRHSDYAAVAKALASLASGGRTMPRSSGSSSRTTDAVSVIETSISLSASDASLEPGVRLRSDQLEVYRVAIRADLPQSQVASWQLLQSSGVDQEPLLPTQYDTGAIYYRAPLLWQPVWKTGQ